jgi:hypothetical protein
MYSSVRQATADLTSAVLGADAGSVVAEGLDTIVAAQARRSHLDPTMDPALHASAHHGALPSPQVAEGLDTIVAAQARSSRLEPKMDPASHASAHHGALSPRCGAQATLSSVTCTGVGWLLQASSDDL